MNGAGRSRPAMVILAGGAGSRIGGNKPLRLVGGETLIDRMLSRARSWSDAVAVSVRDPATSFGAGLPILIDDPAIEGPIAGIASALRFAHGLGRETVMTLPCDTPFLPDDLPSRLAEAIGGADAALPASGDRLHPACALWRSRAFARLDAYLAGGRRSLQGFAADLGHATAAWPDAPNDPFFNINRPADLEAADARLRSR